MAKSIYESAGQFCTTPFIQFAVTICTQLAADLLREQLIIQSETGTAFQWCSLRAGQFQIQEAPKTNQMQQLLHKNNIFINKAKS